MNDDGTVDVDRETLMMVMVMVMVMMMMIMVVITGRKSSTQLLSRKVGSGSREYNFVGDDRMIDLISS